MNTKTTPNNLYEKISAAELDKTVGIRLACLTGNDDFSLFGAEIGPQKKVAAHYHDSGIETYQIVEGHGTMYTGKPDSNNKVTWNEPMEVNKGDCFTIEEGIVHQLINNSDSKLIAIFGCPKAHLSTDRILVNGFGD